MHDADAEGGEQRVERAVAQPLHDAALDDEPDGPDHQRRGEHAEPEAAGRGLHLHQGVHAGHEEVGMGQVDHPQQTEDHGQTEGDQDQNAGQAQSVEDLRQDGPDHR